MQHRELVQSQPYLSPQNLILVTKKNMDNEQRGRN